MAHVKCIVWDEADYDWDSVDYTWDEFCIAITVSGGNTLDEVYDNVLELDDKDKEVFIRLICKVNNVEFDKNVKIKDIKINISDVELVLNKVIGVTFVEVK